MVWKSFTTGGGVDTCVTSTNCVMIRKTLHLFSEIPQESILHYSLHIRPSAYEPNVKSIERVSQNYFQSFLREWNQLGRTLKNLPTISVFKREFVGLH